MCKKETNFSYFLVHKTAGLGDNFCYNNGIEGIDSSLKSEIDNSKNVS